MDEEIQLIDATLAGDTSAFGKLVQRHQDRLYNTLVHVVGCEVEALDVAQDAFVQAFTKLASFQRNAAFYTWLYRIALNLAISRKRRKRTTASIDQLQTDTGQEPVTAASSPHQQLQQQEDIDQVQQALALVTADHRIVLVLREIEDRSYEEIAEILQLPLGTVRSRIHRGRQELKQLLSQAYDRQRPD